MRRPILKFIACLLVVPLAYLATLSVASLKTGYSWAEMDWAQKGYTTVGDFLRAADVGKRSTIINGKPCAEYFAYKDGLMVKQSCTAPATPRQGGSK